MNKLDGKFPIYEPCRIEFTSEKYGEVLTQRKYALYTVDEEDDDSTVILTAPRECFTFFKGKVVNFQGDTFWELMKSGYQCCIHIKGDWEISKSKIVMRIGHILSKLNKPYDYEIDETKEIVICLMGK